MQRTRERHLFLHRVLAPSFEEGKTWSIGVQSVKEDNEADNFSYSGEQYPAIYEASPIIAVLRAVLRSQDTIRTHACSATQT